VKTAVKVVLATLAVLLCFCLFNPFFVMFVASGEVINESGVAVTVHPLARAEDLIHDAPLHALSYPFVPIYPRRFELQPGERRALHYDMDDANFCWLLVRSGDAGWKMVRSNLKDTQCPTDPKIEARCCVAAPEDRTFVVLPVDSLPDAPPSLVQVAEKP
jgi:hypothetical protein